MGKFVAVDGLTLGGFDFADFALEGFPVDDFLFDDFFFEDFTFLCSLSFPLELAVRRFDRSVVSSA